MDAKSFLRGLMFGSLQFSLGFYFVGIALFALFWFLDTNGIGFEPKMIPGAVPGTMVLDKRSRSIKLIMSVILYITVTVHFFILIMRCYNFHSFLKSRNGNVEKCGRDFCQTLIRFSLFLVLCIPCGCDAGKDYQELGDYLKLIVSSLPMLVPMIYNALFMISYGLFYMFFNCKKFEITQVSA